MPWRDLARIRDRLIHGYLTVDYEIVWSVASDRVPAMLEALSRILTDLDG